MTISGPGEQKRVLEVRRGASGVRWATCGKRACRRGLCDSSTVGGQYQQAVRKFEIHFGVCLSKATTP
jgi:hypothetical protein